MPSLRNLVIGTQKVLPAAMNNYKAGENKIESVKITDMVGVKTKLVSAVVRASGRDTGGMAMRAYNTSINFVGLENPEDATPEINGTDVRVRCSCASFYFWFAEADRKYKALQGRPFKAYERRTPPGDPRYPPKNPNMIPGMCKHLLLLTKTLETRKVIR